MACIVCGGHVTQTSHSNSSLGMFCSVKCWREWCTQLHFVKITWCEPRWSHAHASTGGTDLVFVKPKNFWLD